MAIRYINVRGETIDSTGIPLLDLKKYNLGKHKGVSHNWWSNDTNWSCDMFRMALPPRFILPRDFCVHYQFINNIRDHFNLNTIMTDLGFEVETEQDIDRAVKNFEQILKSWEKSKVKRESRKEIGDKLTGGTGTWTKPVNMMIPEIGTVIRLEEDWTFTLHNEHRNSFFQSLYWEDMRYHWNCEDSAKSLQMTLHKGAVLTVDRLYVRKGCDDFSSLTFILRQDNNPVVSFDPIKPSGKGKTFKADGKKGFKAYGITGAMRFWAKLADVNNMKVSFMMETVKK